LPGVLLWLILGPALGHHPAFWLGAKKRRVFRSPPAVNGA
jgi:hypothetical protein